jgi:hypothetical protein
VGERGKCIKKLGNKLKEKKPKHRWEEYDIPEDVD